MNAADSDDIAGFLAHLGYEQCEKLEDADIIVINTCTVRQHAEDRAMSFIGTLKPLKKKNRKLRIFVAGCAASRLKNELAERFPFIEGVIPAYDIDLFDPDNSGTLNDIRGTLKRKSKFITISRGCSNYCSYCVVPYVRGEEVSRPFGEIEKEIAQAAENGIKEITLLGQNVNSYLDSKTGVDFADLLSVAAGTKGLEKLCFMTSHPKDLSDRIISVIVRNKKISREIHLPVQSGSDRILKRMNRKYTRDYYLDLVAKMKKEIPGLVLTTDIIVGFPTETDSDFADTLGLVREVGYDSAFTFKYSPREGTESSRMEDDVPLTVKKSRLAELNETIRKNILCQTQPR